MFRGEIMRRAVALAAVSLAMVAMSPCPAAFAAWICQSESASGTASGAGSSRKEAEDRALGKVSVWDRIAAALRQRDWWVWALFVALLITSLEWASYHRRLTV